MKFRAEEEPAEVPVAQALERLHRRRAWLVGRLASDGASKLTAEAFDEHAQALVYITQAISSLEPQ